MWLAALHVKIRIGQHACRVYSGLVSFRFDRSTALRRWTWTVDSQLRECAVEPISHPGDKPNRERR